jgi:hypothetical protein
MRRCYASPPTHKRRALGKSIAVRVPVQLGAHAEVGEHRNHSSIEVVMFR